VQDLIEIRFHGRAGQGAKSAAQILAEAALEHGYHVQAFPDYGAAREGAPITVYVRISKNPIKHYTIVESPDIVVVIDATLLKLVDVTMGMHEKSVLVTNNYNCPVDLARDVKTKFHGQVWHVDATKIAIDCFGKPITNTPIIGALIRAVGILEFEKVKQHFVSHYNHKFTQAILDANLKAIDRGFAEAEEC
jgi:pyruvate ferredoxin oxidoreductase gamma subunit